MAGIRLGSTWERKLTGPKRKSGPRIPRAPSEGEETFALQIRAEKIEWGALRQHQFEPGRKWAFDFAYPEPKIAIEIDGGTRSNGRHNRHDGYEEDCRKLNAAAAAGWRVFRFTTEQVSRGEAVQLIKNVLRTAAPRPSP